MRGMGAADLIPQPLLAALVAQSAALSSRYRVYGARVEIELHPDWSTACAEERAGHAQGLRDALREALGIEAQVHVIDPGTLDAQ